MNCMLIASRAKYVSIIGSMYAVLASFPAASAQELDRTILPIAEPERSASGDLRGWLFALIGPWSNCRQSPFYP
jgi:hypothetical protein